MAEQRRSIRLHRLLGFYSEKCSQRNRGVCGAIDDEDCTSSYVAAAKCPGATTPRHTNTFRQTRAELDRNSPRCCQHLLEIRHDSSHILARIQLGRSREKLARSSPRVDRLRANRAGSALDVGSPGVAGLLPAHRLARRMDKRIPHRVREVRQALAGSGKLISSGTVLSELCKVHPEYNRIKQQSLKRLISQERGRKCTGSGPISSHTTSGSVLGMGR